VRFVHFALPGRSFLTLRAIMSRANGASFKSHSRLITGYLSVENEAMHREAK